MQNKFTSSSHVHSFICHDKKQFLFFSERRKSCAFFSTDLMKGNSLVFTKRTFSNKTHFVFNFLCADEACSIGSFLLWPYLPSFFN